MKCTAAHTRFASHVLASFFPVTEPMPAPPAAKISRADQEHISKRAAHHANYFGRLAAFETFARNRLIAELLGKPATIDISDIEQEGAPYFELTTEVNAFLESRIDATILHAFYYRGLTAALESDLLSALRMVSSAHLIDAQGVNRDILMTVGNTLAHVLWNTVKGTPRDPHKVAACLPIRHDAKALTFAGRAFLNGEYDPDNKILPKVLRKRLTHLGKAFGGNSDAHVPALVEVHLCDDVGFTRIYHEAIIAAAIEVAHQYTKGVKDWPLNWVASPSFPYPEPGQVEALRTVAIEASYLVVSSDHKLRAETVRQQVENWIGKNL